MTVHPRLPLPFPLLGLLLLLAVACGKPRTQWPLAAARIDCVERGMHKVTGDDLQKAGVNLAAVDTRHMTLVHGDQAVPFHAEGLRDGRLDPEDELYFFSDGATEDAIPYVNIEKDYYPRTQRFMLRLAASDLEPLRYKSVRMRTPERADPARYPAAVVGGRLHCEKNPIFRFINVYTFESQAAPVTTATQAATRTDFIFWAEMTYPPTDKTASAAALTFDLPIQADLGREIQLRARLYAATDAAGATLEHRVAVTLNGKPLGQAAWSNERTHDLTLRIPAGLCQDSNRIEFRVLEPRVLNAGDESRMLIDFIMLDWFELDYAQSTQVEGDEGEFVLGADKAGTRFALGGFTAPDVRIFDLAAREILDAKPFKQPDSTWAVNLERPARPATLAALTGLRMHRPIEIRPVTLAGRFDRPVDCELLVLTHPAFSKALAPLVEWKRSQGLATELVEITELFNEASGGYAGPEALRRYIEHVYKSRPQPRLRYVMLVGDAVSISKYQSFCPDYAYLQSGRHATENYFAAFDKPEGKPQVAVGRISAVSTDQVANVVRKIIDYESGKIAGPWQARFLTIAAALSWAREDAQGIIKEFGRPHFVTRSMQTDLTDKDPQYHERVSGQLAGLLNEGNLVTVFLGHGGGSVWEVGPAWRGSDFQRHLFDQERVAQLTNTDRLPLVCALTCYTNDFDNPSVRQTLGETFVNSPGGAIAVVGAAGRSSTSLNYAILWRMLQAIRDRKGRLGDCFRQALVETNIEAANVNYLLLGDPSLDFRFPQPDLKLSNLAVVPATGRIEVSVDLPPTIKYPTQISCFVLGEREEDAGQWQTTINGDRTMLSRELGAGKLSGKIRLVVYARDGEGRAHVGSAETGGPAPAPAATAAAAGATTATAAAPVTTATSAR